MSDAVWELEEIMLWLQQSLKSVATSNGLDVDYGRGRFNGLHDALDEVKRRIAAIRRERKLEEPAPSSPPS